MGIVQHLIVNTALAFPLRTVFQWTDAQTLLFIVWGVAIDFDHIVFALARFRPFSLANIRKQIKYRRGNMVPGFYFLHSPEINTLLLIAVVWYPALLPIVISNAIHISLDIVEHYLFHRSFRFIHAWSVVVNLRRKLI